MTDKPKGQRMFAVANPNYRGAPHLTCIYRSAAEARHAFANLWVKPEGDWRLRWKKHGLKRGIRIVPVIVTIEERHD